MHEASLASNVLVDFPFENKSLAGQNFPASTCGVHLPTLDLYLVGTSCGLMFAWNSQLELVCEVQSISQSPVLAMCVGSSFLLVLQQDGTLNAFNAHTLEECTVQESTRDTILQAVGEPLAMCVCGEGKFICVAGKRSKSLLVLHIDTLAPAHLLHGQVDFVVNAVTAYGNMLVSCNAAGLLNVWRYSSSQNVGFAQTCTQCKLEFVLREEKDGNRERSVVKLLLVNANTLVIVTNWGECVLAHGFGNSQVVAAKSALLRSTAIDIQFSNDDLYVMLDNGAVLRFDHYMTQHPVIPPSAGTTNTSIIMIPTSTNNKVLLLSNIMQQEEQLALYFEKQQVLHIRTRKFEPRPLTVLVSANNKTRMKHQSVVCKQVAPGVLRSTCFPQIPENEPSSNSGAAYTCLECVEHTNGFFLLAGKENGTLDVFTFCLPLLAKKLPTTTTTTTEVDLCLHKSFLSLHLGRIDSIALLAAPSVLVYTICNTNFEVALLNSKDFSLVHRFAGHQSPIQQVQCTWPFLQVRCESNKTFVWNVQSSGALERIIVDAQSRAQTTAAAAMTTKFALMDIAREMNGLDSSSLGQGCGAVLSLLHKWGVNEDVDTICQTVFGFSRNAALVPMRFVERGKFSSIAVMSHEGDVSWSRLVQFSTKHMVHVCSMYYLLSQYEPNFHPLFTFYCIELPPQGRGDLSVDGLVYQFAHGKTNHIVIRLLVCQQLERMGRDKRKLLLEKWSARVLELRNPKSQVISANAIDPLKRELSTLHPVMEEYAVDPALVLLLVKNAEYQHLVLLLAISCGTHMEEVSPLAARMITEALVESVSIAAAGIDSFLACDLLGLGFMLFRPHIAHMSRLIRSLLHLLVGGDDDVERTDSVRHLLKRIGLSHPVLTIRTIGNELLDVNQTQQFRVAVTDLLVHFSRDEETAVSIMLKYLVMVVEILMKTLDPHDASFRRQCFPTSSTVLQQLVKRFPMCAFHQTSQRFALGTLESTILVYDVRTATKLKVLDGGSDCGPCSALAFDHTGEKIASYSSCEHCVRVWTTHAGFFDNFHVRGTLLAKHPLVRLEIKPNVQQTIRSCRLSWDQSHEVKLRREDSKVVAIRV